MGEKIKNGDIVKKMQKRKGKREKLYNKMEEKDFKMNLFGL